MSQHKRTVSTPNAPAAVGPYSQAVVAGGFVFTAMQLPLDPATGQLVPGGVEAQARQVLRNVQAVLEAAGSSLSEVVKVTVYLADLADFAAVNAIYGVFFPVEPPARAALAVAALPREARIAMEAVGVAGHK
jgi:2-iminobutanoate/2-iminopropanoate deaminase